MARIIDSHEHKPPGLLTKIKQILQFTPERNLFWSWYRPRNFGDWVGPYLYQAIAGQQPFFLRRGRQHLADCFFAAGSILRHIHIPDRVTVWGSGIAFARDEIARPKQVFAVRGPRSRQRLLELGYECPEVYGDPAILLPNFYRPKTRTVPGRIGWIPHFYDLDIFKLAVADDVFLIDVTRPVEQVIDDIASCELTFSSSLHGLIVSHAYGVPTVWNQSIKDLIGDGTKFYDYYESTGLFGIRPQQISCATPARELAAFAKIATLPDLSLLRASLLEACPFPAAASSAVPHDVPEPVQASGTPPRRKRKQTRIADDARGWRKNAPAAKSEQPSP
jgi:hypothetical protein